MHYLKYYENKIIQYDLANKFNYKTTKNLPKLKKIVLNFKTNTFAETLFAIEIIVKKKLNFIRSKKPNIFLKLQKGQPIGGKVILKKILMYDFLSSILIESFPKISNNIKFKKTNNRNTFSIKLTNKNLNFLNIKEHYNLINLLPYLTLTIITNSKTKKELMFLLKSFKINIKQNT